MRIGGSVQYAKSSSNYMCKADVIRSTKNVSKYQRCNQRPLLTLIEAQIIYCNGQQEKVKKKKKKKKKFYKTLHRKLKTEQHYPANTHGIRRVTFK